MKLKICKNPECRKELNQKTKRCPECGKDQRVFWMRHKIAVCAIAFILYMLIGYPLRDTHLKSSIGIETGNSTKTTTGSNTLSEGMYLVGQDIKPGIYRVIISESNSMQMGTVERRSDTGNDSDGHLASMVISGNGYVEILDTDVAVKFSGVVAEPIDLATLTPNIKTEAGEGIYLVGVDLAPGKYKVEMVDTTWNNGYVQRSRGVTMGLEDVITNVVMLEPGFFTIEESDFAVRLQGVKITLLD